jgi:hypothetical protein
MSQEHKAIHLGPRPGEPKPSEPHAGHGGTKFEGVDARPRLVIWSLAIIIMMLVIVGGATIGVQKFLYDANPQGQYPSPLSPTRVLPPEPQLQVHPWEELPELRAHEDKVLSGSGRDPAGHFHIPINSAMDAVIPRLHLRPDTPSGITTPGGEGRAFSGAINAMPAPYQRPRIQGEIHKRAQK